MKKLPADKIVNYLQNHTWKQTAEHFNISEMTISRKIKRLKIVNTINDINYINLLKKGFNKLLKKRLDTMKASELRLVFFLLSNKSISMKKVQYIKRITKITGVKNFV